MTDPSASNNPARHPPEQFSRLSECRLLGRWRLGALVLLAGILVSFIAYLLIKDYDTRLAQHEWALDTHAQQTAELSASFSYFFSERDHDLQSLSTHGVIQTYFSNRDLGMSMEYGLRVSLLEIAERMDLLLATKQAHGCRIYDRIALLDSEHECLIARGPDSHNSVLVDECAMGLADLMPDHMGVFAACADGKEPTVGLAVPCYYKERCVGQVVAQLSDDALLTLFSHGTLPSDRMAWLTLGVQLIVGPNAPLITRELESYLGEHVLPPHHPVSTALPEALGHTGKMILVQAPVAGTHLRVVHLASLEDVLPGPAPQRVLLAMGALALAVLIAVILVVRSTARSLMLASRLDRESRLHQQAVEQKDQLAREIAFRRQAERDLRQAVEIAKHSASAKSAFLANMSHEIRTPMNGIIGMTDVLLATDLTEDQNGYVQIVQRSGEALLNLINDILDLSKIEAGKLKIKMAPFDLRQSLQEYIGALCPCFEAKGLAFSLRIADDVPQFVCGDAGRVGQVVTNLLGNALKFTEAGSVRVDVSLYAATDGEARVQYRVRDTGVGIPPEKMRSIFDAFEQVDSSTTRQYGGTGLGLAICTRLASLLGGRILVESQSGRGSTFDFQVPFSVAESPGADEEGEAA